MKSRDGSQNTSNKIKIKVTHPKLEIVGSWTYDCDLLRCRSIMESLGARTGERYAANEDVVADGTRNEEKKGRDDMSTSDVFYV